MRQRSGIPEPKRNRWITGHIFLQRVKNRLGMRLDSYNIIAICWANMYVFKLLSVQRYSEVLCCI